MPRVVIVGAGLSGLAVAFRLRRLLPGVDLTILERRNRSGGNIWTAPREGFRVEHGPNGFLDLKPSTLQLCHDLGIGGRLIAGSEAARKNRFVFVGNRLRQLPGSPLGILTTPLLSLAGKLALLAEPFRRKPSNTPLDESVAAFARRRFGKEAADVFIDALVTGIHAGDPERLSVRAAFPRMAAFEAQTGSVLRGVLRSQRQRRREAAARGDKLAPQRMWSFREGLRVLVESLTEQVGVPVVMGVACRQLAPTSNGWTVRADGQESWPADAVVLTCPAYEQAQVLADLDVPLAAELAAIPYNRVAVAALGYRQTDVPGVPDGFGYIAPQNTGRDVLGVQWCSSIFPDRAPPGFVLWRALCGGVNRTDVFDWDDDTLVRRCHDELCVTLGVRGMPVFREVVRWPRAIPQYVVGHRERVERIEAAAANHPGLYLTGNAFHGVAMSDVTEQAEQTARRVAARLRGNT